jgi:hypothetical protein
MDTGRSPNEIARERLRGSLYGIEPKGGGSRCSPARSTVFSLSLTILLLVKQVTAVLVFVSLELVKPEWIALYAVSQIGVWLTLAILMTRRQPSVLVPRPTESTATQDLCIFLTQKERDL